MKQDVLKLIQSARGNADDNLYRAKMAFNNASTEQMQEQYGQSGQTCQEVLDSYQQQVDHINACVKWVNNL